MRNVCALLFAFCIAAAVSACGDSPVATKAAPGPRMDSGPTFGGGNVVSDSSDATINTTGGGQSGPFLGGGN